MRLFVVFLAFLASGAVFAKGDGAGVKLRPGFFYFQDVFNGGSTSNSNAVTTTTTYTPLSVALGYTFDMGFYLGGIYDMTSTESKSDPGTTTKFKRTATGVTVGYMKSGWSILAHYLLSAEVAVESATSSVKYTQGSGYIIDLGYSWMLSDMVAMGPYISYFDTTYKKLSDVELTAKNAKFGGIYPSVALWIMF